MSDVIPGGLALTLMALAVQWRLTGVSPVRQVSRAIDVVRAMGYLAGRVGREAVDVARRDWGWALAKARRER
jgi:hypothetical protein